MGSYKTKERLRQIEFFKYPFAAVISKPNLVYMMSPEFPSLELVHLKFLLVYSQPHH